MARKVIGVAEGGEVRVVEVVADLPAAVAGFMAGDTLKAVNNEALSDVAAFSGCWRVFRSRNLLVTINRSGQEQRLSVTPQDKDGKL